MSTGWRYSQAEPNETPAVSGCEVGWRRQPLWMPMEKEGVPSLLSGKKLNETRKGEGREGWNGGCTSLDQIQLPS